MKPDISVVVPTYNRRELLTRCLSSLMEQDLDRDSYEVIVVDDGSDDGTGECVKRDFGGAGVMYTRNEARNGIPSALNATANTPALGKLVSARTLTPLVWYLAIFSFSSAVRWATRFRMAACRSFGSLPSKS